MREGGGAGRDSQRCEAWARGWSRTVGGIRAPTPGPELLRGSEPAGRRGADRAPVGCIQRWAWGGYSGGVGDGSLGSGPGRAPGP